MSSTTGTVEQSWQSSPNIIMYPNSLLHPFPPTNKGKKHVLWGYEEKKSSYIMKWIFQATSALNTYFLVGIFPDLSTMSSSLVCAFWRNVTAGELSCARENASFISVSVHSYNSALKWQTRGLPHSTVYYTVPYGALPTLPYPNIPMLQNSLSYIHLISIK